tara:strand:- start:105 stop:1175 length:1071 start_codon:yes stop_codon:yes gene_type:complete
MAYTTIDKPTDYFNIVLHSGDGTSPEQITGFGFQPDWVWTKTRSNTNNHTLFDSVRGAGASKELSSNFNTAEGGVDTTNYGYLSSFDSDGFTATSGSLGINYFNYSGDTYVNWGWLAGGTASSNTDGTTTSNVSANTTSGFSIVTFTGTGSTATIGHGLGALPSTVIVKCRSDGTSNWVTWHKTFTTNNDYVQINDTNAKLNFGLINNTSNTTSVFGLTGDGNVNGSGRTYVAYVFSEKKGYSKFGSYTGNGNADGTFVYTGFKPAFVIVKQTNASGEGWHILDNKRSGANGDMERLLANSSNAESNYSGNLDLLSNGFKTRINDAGVNGSGSTYIYMAFAENPFVTSSGVPACAR